MTKGKSQNDWAGIGMDSGTFSTQSTSAAASAIRQNGI
jgi:hypothetical protein